MASKRVQYLGINLTKEAKDLYHENYKYCQKKVKTTETSGKTFGVHGLGDVIIKMPIPLKAVLIQSLSESQWGFLQTQKSSP